ncbi:MAG TPA: hypothetical protein VFE53_21460 [Mucilaginibacter sp.]|jgi:hypothetical protein|nr:hypothetical protein [Mucilaginibacter sp.]
MLKSLTRIFFILLGADVVLFICTVVTTLGDEKPPAISRAFYWLLNYVMGFPLALINSDYPFFLQSNHFPPAALVFIAVNNAILALLIWWIIKLLKKLWN